ncbi:hypothetical protein BGW38_007782, partial [Lunasporangiospora selenospora]
MPNPRSHSKDPAIELGQSPTITPEASARSPTLGAREQPPPISLPPVLVPQTASGFFSAASYHPIVIPGPGYVARAEPQMSSGVPSSESYLPTVSPAQCPPLRSALASRPRTHGPIRTKQKRARFPSPWSSSQKDKYRQCMFATVEKRQEVMMRLCDLQLGADRGVAVEQEVNKLTEQAKMLRRHMGELVYAYDCDPRFWETPRETVCYEALSRASTLLESHRPSVDQYFHVLGQHCEMVQQMTRSSLSLQEELLFAREGPDEELELPEIDSIS